MDANYKTLDWSLAFDGPWGPEAHAAFRRGGYDALVLGAGPANSLLESLDFVLDLVGLRSLKVSAKVKRDDAAFMVATLEELVLATGSKSAVPRDALQSRLSRLVMSHRGGMVAARHWPALQSLRLDHQTEDCTFLGDASGLVALHLEGRRRPGSLTGIEACPSLRAITSIAYPIASTAPLKGLRNLREVRLLSLPPAQKHGTIDLRDLAQAHLEELWLSGARELRGLESLSGHPRLRSFRLLNQVLAPADRDAVGSLPPRVRVSLVDCE